MKWLREYVYTCAFFDAIAGYPFFNGHRLGSISNPCSFAACAQSCLNTGSNMGKPSLIADRLRPRGFIRVVAKTAVLPV
jgi:hypothetical protein